MARRWGGRGRHVVVSAYGSFHGRTLATLHATGQPAKHEVFQPLPEGFRHVAWNDIDALAAAIDPTVAAVLLEPVQGEGGVNPADPGYLRERARSLCDERGVLLMLDEVQTGLGRTGRWFGFEHAGHPARRGHPGQGARQRCPHRRLLGPPRRGRHHGAGRPRHHVRRPTAGRGRRPRRAGGDGARGRARPGPPQRRPADRGLAELEGVADVRGLGLLLAAELEPGLEAKAVADGALAAGLVVNAVTPTAIRLAPPLLVSDDEIDEAMSILATVLGDVAARPTAAGGSGA